MVTYIFYCRTLAHKLSSLSEKIRKKIVREQERYKESTKPLVLEANYDLQNNDSGNVLSQCRLELCDFCKNIYDITK